MTSLVPPRLRIAKRAMTAWYRGEPELRMVPRLCRSDAWSLDIGANIGVFTWHMARHSAKVVTFEPQPHLARRLAGAFGKSVQVEQVALSDTEGEAVLRVPDEIAMNGRATVEPTNLLADFPVHTVTVPLRRLDSYELGAVALMKIDVEGHELSVLQGARNLLQRDRPAVIVEAEDRHRSGAVDEVSALLSGFGYAGLYFLEGSLHPISKLGAKGGSLGQAASDAGIYNFVFVQDTRILGL